MVVLVFTAKEHHETSYTKDDKSNQAIMCASFSSHATWINIWFYGPKICGLLLNLLITID